MVRISSPHNQVVKFVGSLDRARERREAGAYLAEGVRLVTEALRSGQTASIVLYNPELLNRSASGSFLVSEIPGWAQSSYEVDHRVLSAAARTESPAGVLAVLRFPEPAPLASHASDPFGLVLDGLSDPGNAGTILRTADAAGAGFVVALSGSVDLFSPKVVRAGMGAHFRLPLYQDVSWIGLDSALPERALVVAEVEGGTDLYSFRWPECASLVVGSEAHGLSPDASSRADHAVHIPMRLGVESLNASVAASIMIYSALGPSLRRM
jgi:TrmH family RNA methyltransferase